jgi:GNAT superfamily N-acetyltransferase
MPTTIITARTPAQIDAACTLVWEFFAQLRDRYPDMLAEIDAYVADQQVAAQLADFAAVFLPPAGECFLAYVDDAPVGLAMLKLHGGALGEMNRMYVRAAARGLGLGRRLGDSVIDQARRSGCETLRLDAAHRHVEALPLYESLGFVRVTDPGAFGGEDARIIHMTLAL